VFNTPIPLSPSHILWINLVTEGIPALALGMDPPDRTVMNLPPDPANENIFSQGLGTRIMTRGLGIGLTTLGVFGGSLLLHPGNLLRARTLAFTNLVASQMFHVYDCRNENRNGDSIKLRANKYLFPAVFTSSGLMLAVIYMPWLSRIFGTYPLDLLDWGTILFSAGALSRLENISPKPHLALPTSEEQVETAKE
jgi:Ca2+-transporting ATPase